MGNVKEHTHCKYCKKVIEFDVLAYLNPNYITDYYVLGICKKCVSKEGLKSIKKKRK